MSKPYRQLPFVFNYSAFFLLALAFVIARCRKDDHHGVPVTENVLTIGFSAVTIAPELVDSAVAYLSKGTAIVRKQLIKKSNDFSVSIKELVAGDWTAKIYVYARVAGDNYPRRYDAQKTFSIGTTAREIGYTAPTGQLTDEWKTRVILAENDRSIVIIASIDPTDPFTEVAINGGPWNYVYIDRTTAIKNADGTAYSDGEAWQCDDDCFQNGKLQFDPNAFLDFSKRMANRNWTRSEIYAMVLNVTTNEERTFYYLYNR